MHKRFVIIVFDRRAPQIRIDTWKQASQHQINNMRLIQETHLKMLIATLGVVDSFKSIWQAIVAFATTRDDLAAAIDNIRAQALKQSASTVGATEDKRSLRDAMCNAAAVVGGAVAAYADKQDNHDLFKTVDFSISDLSHQPEAECVINCTAILNAGTANIASLSAGKHLAQTDLDDLQEKIAAFSDALERPRQVRAGTKSATDQLPAAIAAADRILERQMDRLMERFRLTNPDFYSAYQVARVIVDAGGGSGNGTPTPTPAPQAKTSPPTAAAK